MNDQSEMARANGSNMRATVSGSGIPSRRERAIVTVEAEQ